MKQSTAIGRALLWALLILVFPVGSGVLSAVLTHVFFDLETKIVPLSGPQLLTAEVVRGCLMVLVTVYFGYLLKKESLKPA